MAAAPNPPAPPAPGGAGRFDPLDMPSRSRDLAVAQAMHDLVESVRPEFPRALRSIIERLRADVPEFAEDGVDVDRFAHMCEEQFFTVGALLAAAPASEIVAPAPVTRIFTREAFQWGLSAEALLRLFSVGLRAVWAWWRAIFDTHVEDPTMRIAIIDRSTELLFSYHQTMVQASTEEYYQVQAASRLGMMDRHLRIVRRLVESPDSFPDTTGIATLSQRLGYNLSATHVGFVLWIDAADDDDDAQVVHLAQLARRWLNEHGFGQPLLLPVDGHTFWAWHAVHDGNPRVSRRIPPDAALRVAIGQPARGMSGFRTTHREAVAARRTSLRVGVGTRVVHHADIETIALITGDDEVLRRYVSHKLGALARDDDRTAELRQAVRAYLQAGGHIGRAASMVRVHRNTLARRVEAADHLRAIDHDRVGLALALDIAEAHGTRVLQPTTLR